MSSDKGHIVFVRHGESMGNVWPDAYRDESTNFLTIKGMKQAELAGIDLVRSGFKFSHVITSTMTRARQTATTIMQTMDDWQRVYRTDDRLNEWFKATHVTDPRFQTLKTKEEHRDDVIAAYKEVILPLAQDQDVLVVSHFYTMERLFDNLNVPNDVNRIGWIPNAFPFVFDQGCSWRPPSLKPLEERGQH